MRKRNIDVLRKAFEQGKIKPEDDLKAITTTKVDKKDLAKKLE